MLNASIAPVSPLPAAATAPPAAAAAEPGEFARQLERAAATDTAADADTPEPAAPSRPAGPRETRAKPRAENDRGKTEKAPAQAATGPAEDRTGPGKAAPADEAEGLKASVATDAAVLLASLLNRAVPAPLPGRGDAATGIDTTRANAAAGVETARGGAAWVQRLGAAAADASAALRGQPAAEAADAASRQTTTDAAMRGRERAETGPALNPLASDTPAFMLPQAAAPGAPGTASPGAAVAAPAPYATQIEAPVGSPEFAPGLSAQVSVMVREGVQEARLQLNPAEMGPITVQIQIEGGTAQVTMTAEQAPTRQALEAAMPTLASALREEGLTLTGGGVFEQARQTRDDSAAAAAHPAGRRGDAVDGSDEADMAAAPRRAAPRGMVDLIA